MLTRRRLIAVSAASALAPNLVGRAARSQTQSAAWPNRTVHLIVPIAAGGPTDSVARVVADQLSKLWGQQVAVENKGGAGTNLGNEFVARYEPDGYTMLYGTTSLATNASLFRSLSYDPVADFAPVSITARFPFFIFVPNSSPAKTAAEFIAYAKSRPGKLTMGSPGTGSGPHLAEVLFMQMADIQMTHVPYRGAAPAFTDLIPGRIDCYVGSGELLQYSRSGQVRALATTGAERAAVAPQLPTLAESGVAGYEAMSWQGLFVPAKTPPEIVNKVSADTIAALADPATRDKLEHMAYAAAGSSPQAMASLLKAEIAKWRTIIKTAGLNID
jgi:tripartite-type tricarboxylate transporter receptor subunit TctC